MKIVNFLAGLPILVAAAMAANASETDSDSELPHAFDAGWQGKQTCAVLFESETVRVGKCEFPPGVGHEKHYHNPHFGYVIEGSTMRVKNQAGESEVVTAAGTTWSTDVKTIHEAVNIGTTTASYLIIEPRPLPE